MSDDLVMRLRSNPTYDDISDAADLIDSQQDRIAELEAALRNLDDKIVDLDMGRLELYQVSDFINDALKGGKDD